MFAIKNFVDNDDVRVLGSMGPFTVVEYLKDLSVTPSTAMTAYYCNEMNVRKRQVICDLSKANITLQAGAMQWMAGNVNATTGLKGVGDFFGKAVRGKVTGESAVKPEYTGNGVLVLERQHRAGRRAVFGVRFQAQTEGGHALESFLCGGRRGRAV